MQCGLNQIALYALSPNWPSLDWSVGAFLLSVINQVTSLHIPYPG